MNSNQYNTENVNITLDESLNIITLTWLKNTSSEEYRRTYNNALELANTNRTKKWILDQSLKDGITLSQDSEWLEKVWWPILLKNMGKGLKVSVILSKNVFAEMSAKKIINQIANSHEAIPIIESRFHQSKEEGMNWLKSPELEIF